MPCFYGIEKARYIFATAFFAHEVCVEAFENKKIMKLFIDCF